MSISALLNVFDYVMQMLDGGCSTFDMVYLGFFKMFDKVNHMAFSVINGKHLK